MKIKVATNDENYKEVVLKRAIIICWVLLAICFIIKIFGGNFFNIICEYENFAKFCDFVDNNVICKIVMGFISTFTCNTLFYLAICRKLKFTKLEVLYVIIISIICVIIKIFFKQVSFIADILQCFIAPFLIKRSERVICFSWFSRVLIYGNILNFIFQLISMAVRNLAISLFVYKSTLILTIFSIDCYIMLALYYLYSNSIKGDKKMSWFMEWLWGKSKTQLESMLKTRLRKKAKLDAEKEKLDAEIEEIKKEIAKKD